MCGIAGVLKLGQEPISPDMLTSLLLGIQHRGGDATGIAMMTGNRLTVHKKDEIAWKYVASEGYKNYLRENLTDQTHAVILHTRAWTVGSPHKNENNHPLTLGRSAIVHNGGVSNHNDLFKELNLKRGAETDSDIIRAIVDKEGMTKKAIRVLNRLSGPVAAAILHQDFPRHLMLLRSGSPLVLGKYKGFLMWASEKKAIHVASRQWQKKYGLYFQANRADLMFNPMYRESGWILDIDEMIAHEDDGEYEPWHDEFKSCQNYTRPTYNVHEKFQDKQNRKEAEKAKDNPPPVPLLPVGKTESGALPVVKGNDEEEVYVECPNCSTKEKPVFLFRSKALENVPLTRVKCSLCNKPFAGGTA